MGKVVGGITAFVSRSMHVLMHDGCTIWALGLFLMAQGGNETGLTAEDINDRAIHSHIRAMQMLIFTLSHSLRQKSTMHRATCHMHVNIHLHTDKS